MAAPPCFESIVGSRVIEVDYTSFPNGEPLGNFIAIGSWWFNLSASSRVIEVDYVSNGGT